MNVFQVIAEGLRRAAGAPRLVLGLWLVNVLAALPAALVMIGILEDSIGASLFHRTLTEGFDSDWYAEYAAETEAVSRGLARTFGPGVIGAAAVYENLEAWWSGRLFTSFPMALVALGVAYGALWALLLGGVLDALGRGTRGLGAFLAAGGRTFGRFVQLTIASAVAYLAIYRLARWLFGWLEEATRDVTSESTVFAWVLVVVALAVALLHLVRMLLDYAKIAVATADVSAVAGLARALRFVASRPGRTVAVYGGLGLAVLAVVAVYAWIAPGAGESTWMGLAAAFALSQLYLIARLYLRLALLAAEMVLFQESSSPEEIPLPVD